MQKRKPIKRVKITETWIPLERLVACRECLPKGIIEGDFALLLPEDVPSITVTCKKHGRSKTIAQLPRKRMKINRKER